jgi:hypothetical protein
MSLFVGLSKTDYQDLLRALGHALDHQGWRDLRLVEDDGGLVLQGRLAGDLAGGFLTERLMVGDCLTFLHEAYQRRGSGQLGGATHAVPGPPQLPSLEVHGYAGVLRAAGRWLDGAGWRMVRLVERREALVVQGSPRGWVRRGFTTHFLLDGDLRALLGDR